MACWRERDLHQLPHLGGRVRREDRSVLESTTERVDSQDSDRAAEQLRAQRACRCWHAVLEMGNTALDDAQTLEDEGVEEGATLTMIVDMEVTNELITLYCAAI